MDVTVASSSLASLNSQLAGATDAQVELISQRICSLARRLRDRMAASNHTGIFHPLAIFDSTIPEQDVASQQLNAAIEQLQAANDTESRKASLVYLQATVEVIQNFVPTDPSIMQNAIDDFANGVATVLEEVLRVLTLAVKPLLPSLAPLTTLLEWGVVALALVAVIVVSFKWGKA